MSIELHEKLTPAKKKSDILEPMKPIGKDIKQWEKLKRGRGQRGYRYRRPEYPADSGS